MESFGRTIEIDLASVASPIMFAPLFAAKYTDDKRFAAQAVSKRVHVIGDGIVTFIDANGKSSPVTFATTTGGESRRDIEAVGIDSISGTFDVATVML
jgi:hypothetical protein